MSMSTKKKGMKKMQNNPSIIDLWEKKMETLSPLIYTGDLKAEFIDAYVSDHEIIDSIIVNKYHSRVAKTSKESSWNNLTRAFLYSKKYMLETLYKTMFYEYDPLENFNAHEEETTENDNTRIDDFVKGALSSNGSSITGSQELTESYNKGETQQHTKSGSHIDNITTNGNNSTNDSTTSNVAPYEDSSQHPKEWVQKNVNGNNSGTQMNSYGDHITEINDSPRHDTQTTNAGQRHDTFEHHEGTRSDSGTKVEDLYQRRVLNRAGNLGVTTSQQMLVSEREDAAPFDFWKIFAREFVAFCCLPYCEGVY